MQDPNLGGEAYVRLARKVALVTGSTSGLGQATAEAFAREGAAVVVTGRDQARGAAVVDGIVAAGGSAAFVAADLSDTAAVQPLADAALEAFGPIDVLVNNAGAWTFGSLVETTEPDFDWMFTLNVKVPLFLTQAVVPAMTARGSGKIINITTMVATFGRAGAGVYGASKAAMALLTKAWAVELGPAGINVNAISPGAIRTPGTEFMSPIFDEFAATLPAGAIGMPGDVAEAAVYLASAEADYIHGVTLPVDGGRLAA
jgi:NAD(P)-dependent dehydrogenase (short-subunit alcohol dehydrogenase family)